MWGKEAPFHFVGCLVGKYHLFLWVMGLGKDYLVLWHVGVGPDQLIVWGVGWGPTVLSCGVWNGDKLCDLGGWRRAN